MQEAAIDLSAAKSSITADEAYERLRAGIRGAFTMLVENNRPLVMEPQMLASYDDLLDVLVDLGADRQYYECQHCRSFWNYYSRVYGVNPDSTLTSPVYMVLQSLYAEHGVMVPLRHEPKKTMSRATMPLHKLGYTFTTSEAGGFTHFHGCDEQAAKIWTEARKPFVDRKFIEAFIIRMRGGVHYTAANIAMLHAELKDKVRLPKAIGLLTPYADLLKTIADIKPTSLTTFLQIMLMEEANSWIYHLDGSTAGMVLDELRTAGANDLTPQWIDRLLGKVNAALDGDQYKKRTAPTSVSAVQQATAFLKDGGWEKVIERRYVGIDEVEGVWTKSDVAVAEQVVEQVDTRSALEKAADEFVNKNSKQDQSSSLAAAISARRENTRSIQSVSLAALINILSKDDSIAQLKLNINHPSGHIYSLVTDAIDDTVDYSGLLKIENPATPNLPWSTYIVSTSRVTGQDVRSVIRAEMAREASETNHRATLPEIPVYFDVKKVTAILRNDGKSTPALMALLEENRYLRTMFGNAGTLLLGSMIENQHYGYSRAICQLSEKIPMANTEVASAGGLIIDVGSQLDAVYKDGRRVQYTITAVE